MKKRLDYIPIVIILITLVVLFGVAAILLFLKEEKNLVALTTYLEEEHELYLEVIPSAYSSGSSPYYGVKELRYPIRWLKTKEQQEILGASAFYFHFARRQKAAKVWEKIPEEYKDNVVLVNSGIFIVTDSDIKPFLEEAKEYFEENKKTINH